MSQHSWLSPRSTKITNIFKLEESVVAAGTPAPASHRQVAID